MGSIILNDRQLCDLELLLNGGFAPLNGFLNEKDYYSVLRNMRLSTGELWPMPIVLSVSDHNLSQYRDEKYITLKDQRGISLAILELESVYKPDLKYEAKMVLGTKDKNHPYVNLMLKDAHTCHSDSARANGRMLLQHVPLRGAMGVAHWAVTFGAKIHYLGGKVTQISSPVHYDFCSLRRTPTETKKYFQENGWTTIVGFQTRNPMHRSHLELTKYALQQTEMEDAKLLLHPVVGVTQACDINYHTRVRCYQKLLKYYPDDTVLLSLLPLSMRMAGPREALWHALIRKNYGCTHFVVGRDHAGPSAKKKNGESFYQPYEAHELIQKYQDEIGIKIIMSQMIVYVRNRDIYTRINETQEGDEILNISGTQQRHMLANNEEIPEWFSFPEIVEELRKNFKPLHRKGFCLYFVGLSGSGKSTLANAIKSKLEETESERKITILDGDVVRLHLSKGLGFSKEDRSINVQRIGYVASEVVKHNGIAICANIAPYQEDREINRKTIEEYGTYLEIFVDTKLEICEQRDIKGLYKLARKGIIKNFTGISDPFERPKNPTLVIDGSIAIESNMEIIIDKLKELNLVL